MSESETHKRTPFYACNNRHNPCNGSKPGGNKNMCLSKMVNPPRVFWCFSLVCFRFLPVRQLSLPYLKSADSTMQQVFFCMHPSFMNQTCLACGYFLMEDMEDIYIICKICIYIYKCIYILCTSTCSEFLY